MTATILDGAKVAADIRRETAEAVSELAARGAVPGLVVLLAGEDPASHVYVRNKEKGAREAGLRTETLRFPATVTEAMLLAEIGRLNADPEVDAILVQLPLPVGIGSSRILEAVDPAKDVDGFHPFNVGRLVQGKPAPVPCTPAGVMELLRREDVPLRGTRAVVLGRSDIVGKPMATLLTKADATVTVAHSKTRDLPALCREADLLVAAIGRPAFVTADYIREGAVVVDVGINRIDTAEEVARCFPGNEAKAAAFASKGSLFVGDVHPVDVAERASRYTPVPGGVGPLTIARLLANTVDLCRARRRL
ncbi:MAG: bifunctional 5,10-methylenetetrahydrofolate dehydrogenase/5,10-methenyltetrahydrofolate cyclohydrolase [Thermoanaerobaculia bacterium]|jgi:methylenetetrahydrofolate dehydrogenase (NADP+)/methenyltetrahydrofolate cyclohydrolase|nr:bifunctional 5,10-methylenetetrahydrofolate dehydrogenase/5,10-methenyltetrahydrofolate cyclohydrolase [Thermoanaerobaculia bacterium]